MMFVKLLVALFLHSAASSLSAVQAADIPASSTLGRALLAHSELLHGRELDDTNYSFLSSYSIKFQGCHHVQQWNDNADGEDDVRIMTKRLVRYRLCPTDQCSNEKSAGCTSKYGDYIVDMDTFVASYLYAMQSYSSTLCSQVSSDCSNTCGGTSDADCTYSCYQAYSADFCLSNSYNNGNGNGYNFNALNYAQCTEFDMSNNGNRRSLEEAVTYYIGAYCSDQGGDVKLSVFTDNTCTTFASNGVSLFKSTMGFSLPYSSSSLISTRCMDCAYSSSSNGNNNNNNNNNNNGVQAVCSSVYALSGKCETRMSIDYPNESSCNYIEGVKIIRQDGVIRTSQTRKSKSAAVAIGLFTTLSVLLGGYVFYLRTKLARAQINLAAASQSLV